MEREKEREPTWKEGGGALVARLVEVNPRGASEGDGGGGGEMAPNPRRKPLPGMSSSHTPGVYGDGHGGVRAELQSPKRKAENELTADELFAQEVRNSKKSISERKPKKKGGSLKGMIFTA